MDPAATIRRAVNYAIMVVGALGIAYAMSPLRIMRITVQVCTIAAVSSLMLRVTPHGILVHSATGETDFRGVFSFKNMLGEAMAAGVLGALYCAYRDQVQKSPSPQSVRRAAASLGPTESPRSGLAESDWRRARRGRAARLNPIDPKDFFLPVPTVCGNVVKERQKLRPWPGRDKVRRHISEK